MAEEVYEFYKSRGGTLDYRGFVLRYVYGEIPLMELLDDGEMDYQISLEEEEQ